MLSDDMDMTPGNRHKVLRLSPDSLVWALKARGFRVTANALPEDAKIVSVRLLPDGLFMGALEITVASESFDRAFIPYPEITPVLERVAEEQP